MDTKTLHQITSEHYDIRTKKADAEEQARIDATGNIFLNEKVYLTPKVKPCPECQLEIVNRRVTYMRKEKAGRGQFWEIRCLGCDNRTTVNSLGKLKKK